MTDKKKKYQPQPEDHKPMKTGNRKRFSRQMFVARIVNTEDQAMTAKEVHALMNKKVETNRGRTHIQTQANLADAVKASLLDKTRVQVSDTKTQVKYHPIWMKPMGLDIPIPAHTRSKKPDAVKVAEKVLADLGASDADLDDLIPPHTKHTPIDKDVFNRLAEKYESEGLIGDKKDKVKLHYVGRFIDEYEEKEHEVEGFSWVSKTDYIRFYEETAHEPCKCNEQGCLSCFIEETVGWADGFGTDVSLLWFGKDENGEQWNYPPVCYYQSRAEENAESSSAYDYPFSRIKHNKDALKDFDPEVFVKKMTEQRDALVSTVQHHFTAEQLIESLSALNPDLHDAVLITIAKAMGKTVNDTNPIRCMSWDYSNGNLVVKE